MQNSGLTTFGVELEKPTQNKANQNSNTVGEASLRNYSYRMTWYKLRAAEGGKLNHSPLGMWSCVSCLCPQGGTHV